MYQPSPSSHFLYGYCIPCLTWDEPLHCTFMFRMVQYIIHLTLLCLGTNLSQGDEKLLSDILIDPCATKKAFSLDSKTTILAICLNPIAILPIGQCPKAIHLFPYTLIPATTVNFEVEGNVVHYFWSHELWMGTQYSFWSNPSFHSASRIG